MNLAHVMDILAGYFKHRPFKIQIANHGPFQNETISQIISFFGAMGQPTTNQ